MVIFRPSRVLAQQLLKQRTVISQRPSVWIFRENHNFSTADNWLTKCLKLRGIFISFCGFQATRMGSSNCKSFSPSKVSASAKIKDTTQGPIEEYVEGVVCQENDIGENEMKSFDLGGDDGGKVLLIKQNGVLSALGAKCTHYGAPLAHGVLGQGRVRCQWHGACFNIKNGDIEDFPGLDSLPCFRVTVENGSVKVRAKKSELQTSKRTKPLTTQCSNEKGTIVVVGGGPSGATCVETLRQEGYSGRLVFVCKEAHLPYDRVKVSKALDFDIEKAQFRTMEFYKKHHIEVLLNTEVTSLNSKDKTLNLSNGVTLPFDSCYIATGLTPSVPNIPGNDLGNIFTMRNFEDAIQTHVQLMDNKHVVVLGFGFIGLETAAYCSGKVSKVSIVGNQDIPLKRVFGEHIGNRIKSMFEEKGVEFYPNNGIEKINGEDGYVTSVELKSGQTLKADVLIFGIGSTMNTQFLANSGIEMNPDGSLPVNLHMETNISGIFAGGDIASAAVYPNQNEPAVIGHYGLAHYHGRVAALNILKKRVESKSVPYFWTSLLGKGFRYCGYGDFNDIIIDGDLNEMKFLAFFLKDDKVVAMASCGRDPVVSQFAELLAQGKHLTRADIQSNPIGWTKQISAPA